MKLIKIIRFGIFTFLGICLLALVAFGNDQLLDFWFRNRVEPIYPEQAQRFAANENTLIVDARAVEEFEVSHLPNAKHFEEDLSDQSRDMPVLVYCTVGYRSALMAEKLKEQGFQKVYNLSGGLIHWKNIGLDVVNKKGEVTDSVHVYEPLFGLLLRNGIAVE